MYLLSIFSILALYFVNVWYLNLWWCKCEVCYGDQYVTRLHTSSTPILPGRLQTWNLKMTIEKKETVGSKTNIRTARVLKLHHFGRKFSPNWVAIKFVQVTLTNVVHIQEVLSPNLLLWCFVGGSQWTWKFGAVIDSSPFPLLHCAFQNYLNEPPI